MTMTFVQMPQLSEEVKLIKDKGNCTYDHFTRWLESSEDFVSGLDDDTFFLLEQAVHDQVVHDWGLPNDTEYFQANPDRPFFRHVMEGDREYLLAMIRAWHEGEHFLVDKGRWDCMNPKKNLNR